MPGILLSSVNQDLKGSNVDGKGLKVNHIVAVLNNFSANVYS